MTSWTDTVKFHRVWFEMLDPFYTAFAKTANKFGHLWYNYIDVIPMTMKRNYLRKNYIQTGQLLRLYKHKIFTIKMVLILQWAWYKMTPKKGKKKNIVTS